MEYGHIVLSRSHHFTANAIAYMTDSYFSHTFITVPPISGRLICFEAVGGGVEAVPFDIGYEQDDSEEYIIYSLQVSNEIKDQAISEIMNTLERPYGYTDYLWFIWRWICKKFGKDIKKDNNWVKGGIVCSELVTDYLKACGLSHLFEGYGDGSVVPQDIYDIVKQNPQYFVEVSRKLTKDL